MEYKLTFKEYNEALKKDKLLGLKCKECGKINVPPKMVCGQCTSLDMEVVELSGKGNIQTFTTVFVAPEGREAEAPYTIVMVELDEGPWIAGNLIDIDPGKVTMELIGKRVKLGHKVFPGDKYSAGDMARPLFSFES
ncbi:MAG TPA: Zn-ribbon domain-containing OB-fold protein [Dehalococcoidia bacterium]|nr:Zn-ribbon domain-containing OB-fold protein [Dehalococcoidia bacterium]